MRNPSERRGGVWCWRVGCSSGERTEKGSVEAWTGGEKRFNAGALRRLLLILPSKEIGIAPKHPLTLNSWEKGVCTPSPH